MSGIAGLDSCPTPDQDVGLDDVAGARGMVHRFESSSNSAAVTSVRIGCVVVCRTLLPSHAGIQDVGHVESTAAATAVGLEGARSRAATARRMPRRVCVLAPNPTYIIAALEEHDVVVPVLL